MAETGLNQNWNRDYDPLTAKYAESDPIGFAGGSWSTYAYTRGNPISRKDSVGLSSVFYSDAGGLQIYTAGGQWEATFPAANNTVSSSVGSWPDGTYSYAYYKAHSDDADPNSPYGSNGIFIFNRGGCTGCGLHSGRANRGGIYAATLGCIRTTDDATAYLKALNQVDPITMLVVSHDGTSPAAPSLSSLF